MTLTVNKDFTCTHMSRSSCKHFTIEEWLKISPKTNWRCGIELSSQSSDKNSSYNRKLRKFARFRSSTLGFCNAYLNIGHDVGMFDDWPDCFRFGANRNVSGKLGMKLAIGIELSICTCIQCCFIHPIGQIQVFLSYF